MLESYNKVKAVWKIVKEETGKYSTEYPINKEIL
jgi:hypothetical protein